MTDHPRTLKSEPWQRSLSQIITDPKQLLAQLKIDDIWLEAAEQAARIFPLRAPLPYVSRIQPCTIDDPLLRQILPIGAELSRTPGYSDDPLAERNVNPHPGLLHKYRGRVLLTVSRHCPIHCRYCFRRAFPYADNNPGQQGWHTVMQYIDQDNSIEEVILSGGDPLSAPDNYLRHLIQAIAQIPHISRLRIHSRFPIVIPARITPTLCQVLTETRLQPIMVVHCNHPQEIDTAVHQALTTLNQAGITTLNQSVLLRQVNDTASVLTTLSKHLFESRVLPYYLHQLDKIQGSAHFAVTQSKAKQLIQQLQAQLPGYLVPKLVEDIPDMPAKQAL